ncbi:ABC transporter A like protein, partial [Aduncisulcus paluster]
DDNPHGITTSELFHGEGSAMWGRLGCCLLGSIVLHILGMYIDIIMPHKSGVHDHPLFFCRKAIVLASKVRYHLWTNTMAKLRLKIDTGAYEGAQMEEKGYELRQMAIDEPEVFVDDTVEITFKDTMWAIGMLIAHPFIAHAVRVKDKDRSVEMKKKQMQALSEGSTTARYGSASAGETRSLTGTGRMSTREEQLMRKIRRKAGSTKHSRSSSAMGGFESTGEHSTLLATAAAASVEKGCAPLSYSSDAHDGHTLNDVYDVDLKQERYSAMRDYKPGERAPMVRLMNMKKAYGGGNRAIAQQLRAIREDVELEMGRRMPLERLSLMQPIPFRQHFKERVQEVKYDTKWAVRGVSWTIHQSECVVLLGRNGAGKSTTVHIMCGLYAPTDGSMRSVDMMFVLPLECRLSVSLSVFVLNSRRWCSQTSRAATLSFILDVVGLGNQSIIPSSHLSGGMRRRLAVGMALCGNPEVILLDEPTTGLDPHSRRKLWNAFLQAKQNRCILITTHSMEEAEALADRIFIMSSGRVIAGGSHTHLKNRFDKGSRLVMSCPDTTLATKTIKGLIPEAVVNSVVSQVIEFDIPGDVIKGRVAGLLVMSCPDTTLATKTIKGLIPEAVVNSVVSQVIEFDIPGDVIKGRVAGLFEKLEALKTSIGVIDWSLSGTTLEQVFLEVVAAAEKAQKDSEE